MCSPSHPVPLGPAIMYTEIQPLQKHGSSPLMDTVLSYYHYPRLKRHQCGKGTNALPKRLHLPQKDPMIGRAAPRAEGTITGFICGPIKYQARNEGDSVTQTRSVLPVGFDKSGTHLGYEGIDDLGGHSIQARAQLQRLVPGIASEGPACQSLQIDFPFYLRTDRSSRKVARTSKPLCSPSTFENSLPPR